MSKDMQTCRLCNCNTTGHKNDLFDKSISDLKTLAGYMLEERYNQAGNVLISSARSLMATYSGCACNNAEIQKYA